MRRTRHGMSSSMVASVILATAACQDITGPEVTPPPPDAEEAPAPSLRHNAAVVLRRAFGPPPPTRLLVPSRPSMLAVRRAGS